MALFFSSGPGPAAGDQSRQRHEDEEKGQFQPAAEAGVTTGQGGQMILPGQDARLADAQFTHNAARGINQL